MSDVATPHTPLNGNFPPITSSHHLSLIVSGMFHPLQVSSYPRRVYGHDCRELALDALGLGNQVALFVQPEDEEGTS